MSYFRLSLQSIGLIFSILLLASCGGGGDGDSGSNTTLPADSQKPSSAILVGMTSLSSDSVNLEWLPGSDNQTLPNDLKYDIYLDTQSGFQPSTVNKKLTVSGTNNATITSLSTNTQYFSRLATIDDKGNQSISGEMSVTTHSIEVNINQGTQVVEQKSTNIPVVSDTSVQFIDADRIPQVGDILVASNESYDGGYLRRATSVSSIAGTHTVITEPASVGEIFQNIQISTNVHLVDIPNQVAQRTNKYAARGSQQIKKMYQWDSGLEISSEEKILATASRFQSKVAPGTEANISEDDYFKLSIPTNYALNKGDLLEENINLTDNLTPYSYSFIPLNGTEQEQRAQCEKDGGVFDTTLVNECKSITAKVCDVNISTTPPSGLSQDNLPVITGQNSDWIVSWQPNDNNIDYSQNPQPYTTEIETVIGYGDCDENQRINILIVSTELHVGEEPSLTLTEEKELFKSDDAKITLSTFGKGNYFDPKLSFSGLWVNGELADGHGKVIVDFGREQISEIIATAQKTYNFTPRFIASKKFIKVYAAGPVPIVITGDLRFYITGKVESSGAIKATSSENLNFHVEYGLQFDKDAPDGQKWKPIQEKNTTYKIKLTGEGNAQTYLELRFVPDVNIKLYELVATHMIAEPYLYGEAGIEGKVEVQTSNVDNTYADANYRFTSLEGGVGVDLRFFAGTAWDNKTISKYLHYPSGSTFSKGSSSTLKSDPQKLKDYYDHIVSDYKLFSPLPPTAIATIPNVTLQVDYDSTLLANSRAIKLIAKADPPTGLIDKFWQWERWAPASVFTNNATIINTEPTLDGVIYWVEPGNDFDIGFRVAGHSTIGSWARQSAESTLTKIGLTSEGLPQYWIDRYAAPGQTLLASTDDDLDGASNLLEYQSGTNPIDDSSFPSGSTPIPLAIPQNIQATEGDAQVTVSWNSVLGASSYNLYIAEQTGLTAANYASFTGGTAYLDVTSPEVISNLSNGRSYYLVVTAINATGDESIESTEVIATPQVENTGGNLAQGLIAHYEFEGDANDSSGNGNHGTENGEVAYTTGVSGQAASFDGVDDFVNLGNLPNDSVASYSVWFKTNQDKRNQAIIGDYVYSSYIDGSALILMGSEAPSERLWFYTENDSKGSGGRSDAVSNGNYHDGEWYHAIGVIDETEVRFYINGVLVATEVRSYASSNNDFYVGYADTDPSGSFTDTFFNGQIDELRIYNRTLSQTEIAQLAGSNINSGLVAHYEFEGNVDDSSGNGNHGTESGDVAYPVGAFGLSLQLDGVDDYISLGDKFDSSQTFTLSSWVKFDAGCYGNETDCHSITKHNHSSPSKKSFSMGKVRSVEPTYGDKFLVRVNDGTLNFVEAVSVQNIVQDTWYIITTVFDNGNLKLYINGSLVDQSESNIVLNDSLTDVRMGTTESLLGFMDGSIDDMRVYNRALSQTEIEQLAGSNINSGLMAHYGFEGNANDSSGNGNHGTENGGVTYATGVSGQAASFDGVNDLVSIPSGVVQSSGSVSLWFNPDTLDSSSQFNGNSYIFAHFKPNASPGSRAYIFHENGDVGFAASEPNILNSGSILSTSSFQHLALTWNDTSFSGYLNGQSLGSMSKVVTGGLQHAFLGGFGYTGVDFAKGVIDEVRIYNRALSESEIQQLATP
jgi:hypothetical protein